MTSIPRAAAAVASVLVREGVDYAQSKAVFKAARARAGLRATPERRHRVDRLTVEEELRFLDHSVCPGRQDRTDAANLAGNRRPRVRTGAAQS